LPEKKNSKQVPVPLYIKSKEVCFTSRFGSTNHFAKMLIHINSQPQYADFTYLIEKQNVDCMPMHNLKDFDFT